MSQPVTSSLAHSSQPPLRPANLVMDLERLGCYHQTRLSFMRTLVRRIMCEQWRIEPSLFELDNEGYGTVVYEVKAPGGTYSFVLFSNYLAPEDRNDRVIANQWDLTMALCEGVVDKEQLEELRANVPKQEAGRMDARVFVLSRANRSSRNFDYVVDKLANGQQPDPQQIAEVGYLYRTTAVYGSGKLGMADWQKVRKNYPDFARPFAAAMFTCYMLRHFSMLQAEHIARLRSPQTAVSLDEDIKRYFGIGNSTGLGMAPFLINHPLLINQWITCRETALAHISESSDINQQHVDQLKKMAGKALQHVKEVVTNDERQSTNNAHLIAELEDLMVWLKQNSSELQSWLTLQEYAKQHWRPETQEVINSLLMELYPELVDGYEDDMCVDEDYDLQPEMLLTDLQCLIEDRYQWALDIDFSLEESQQVFWYRSEEKLEPRLGQCGVDEGKEKEMFLWIARAVRQCYDILIKELQNPKKQGRNVAHLLLVAPEVKGIIRRMQTLAQQQYGDIQANLIDKDVLPIHLLRCKLSFFGVSKFDPKSRLWVRNTMFQGAPLISDIGQPFTDDWYFPIAPKSRRQEVQA